MPEPQIPAITPATDEAFSQKQNEQAQAMRNYNYLVAHPDEATKYGMDPADFRPMATPEATQSPDPTHAELSPAKSGDEGGDPTQPVDTRSDARQYLDKGVQDVKQFFTGGLLGNATGWLSKKAGASPDTADTVGKITNVAANLAAFIPAKAEGAVGEGIEALRGAGEDTSTLGKVIEGAPKPVEGAPATAPVAQGVSPNGETAAAAPKQQFMTPEGKLVGEGEPSPQDDFLAKIHKMFGEDVEAQRRGVRPNAVTAADSEKVPTAWLDRVLETPGQSLNAEQLYKLEKFAEGKGKELQGVAQQILQEPDQAKRMDMLMNEYKPQVEAFGQWHAYAKGAEAESGRSLQIMKSLQEAKGYRENLAENFQTMLADDPANWEKHVLAMGNANNGKEAAELAIRSTEPGAANGPTWSSRMLQWAMNAGLSSTTLPARKLLTDTLTFGSKVAAYSISGRIFRSTDIPAGMDTAALRSIPEGLADFWKYLKMSYKSGMPEWSIENGVHTGFANDPLDGTPLQRAASYMDFMGKRHIQALGEGANAMFYRMELRAQAYKQASQEARAMLGDSASAREITESANAKYAAKMEVLPKSLRDSALQQTELDTFRHVTDGMKSVEDLRDKTDKLLGHIPLARMAMLFYRTPWNIQKLGLEMSPLGFLSAAKNMGQEGNSLTVAKASMGTAVAAMTWYMHHQGLITGNGPGDPEMRRAWLKNHKPYCMSFDGGKNWHSYADMPVVGDTMRAMADGADIYARMPQHDAASMAAMLTTVAARALVHQPFMNIITGIADFVTQHLQGEEGAASKSAGDYLSRLIIPQVVNASAKVVDPVVRKTQSFIDEWKEKIPGWSKSLPPDRTAFAQPHFISGGYKPEDAPGYAMKIDHFLSPLPKEKIDQDPVYNELDRLGIDLSKPSRAVHGTMPSSSPFRSPSVNSGYVLDDKQYDRLQVLAGEGKYDRMEKTINAPWYQKLADPKKAEILQTINKSFNSTAQKKLMHEDPTVISGMAQNIRLQAARKAGKVSVATP